MELIDYLQKLRPMPQKVAEEIVSFTKDEQYDKNTLIIKEGGLSKRSFYLESGYIRCYILDKEGREITTRIFSSPIFLNDYQSFFKKQACDENYETITDCITKTLDLETLQYCFHNIPEFREWGRMMLTMHYVEVHQRMLSLMRDSAEERYIKLLEEHPDVIQHVPLKIIASYIGVTDSSLSRIRKDVSKNLS